jgi:Flp pilus assembly protein TadG
MKARQTRRGQTAVLFTLSMLPLFGVLGLVIDVGWAYYRKEAAQTAADAAASAAAQAAFAAASGGAPTCSTTGVACYATEFTCPTTFTTATDNIVAGCMYAKENGFVSTGKQLVTFQSGVGSAPTASGATVAYWVVVRVKEQIPQLFSSVLGFPNAMIVARTTTGTRVASSGGCVITLNPTASGAITMTGNSSITTGCGVFDNSNSPSAVSIVGSGTITTTGTAKTDIVGNWSGSGTITPAPRTGQSVMSDPFADMAAPTYSGCANSGMSGGSHDALSLPGGTTTTVICGDISLGSHSTLTLGAGLYVVTGNISVGAQAGMSGSGVTIYLPNGGVTMTGGATIDMSAPSSGAWQGILFYQRRGNTTASNLVGGTTQQMNGVLYFPSAPLTYTGGSGTVATQTTLVSDTLTLVGGSSISASASTAYTGSSGGISVIE